MLVTLNEEPVVSMRLVLPLVGPWTARVETNAVDSPTAVVVLSDGRHKLHATVTTVGNVAGRLKYTIIGGAGGLNKAIAARSYKEVSIREVAESICTSAGEALGPCPRDSVAYWTHPASTASEALTKLAEAHGLSWRVLDSGKVWLGVDEFPELQVEDDEFPPLVLDRDGPLSLLELGVESFKIRPGLTLKDSGKHKLVRVEYLQSDNLRVHAYYEPKPVRFEADE